METKRCSKCGRELPTSEFAKSSLSKDGFQSYCKACQSEAARIRYQQKSKTKVTKMEGEMNPDLSQFTPRELMQELSARGCHGKLSYTKEIMI